ncbi:cellular morphogenesis regulator dopa [Dothidotthia symphoricarpi CBS 119687]|uniref:Cellular morphogenesis regulator dopa n=1 Tax=Dothidotthia symphoricarpi CBS 119687 TaxID=1392245 RepID=A0A6A6AE81_9PLEO|nr:cellular morphogenesis regulator dopa [Dothidotthia symphoricarpi CBS 119687]KAF2129876.1 cellular morphogenesis regulator dopa [Dothidotthia symphoricarpi CBS 119687]
MSMDPSANLQIYSPPASGRSSPAPRAYRNATEESLYKKDKSFRRYAAGLERALALWDTAQQEWADYISFLGRLLKALQSHPPEIPVIPHSDTVALRLAQCLNPALPSGVHQKALEVYGYVFSTIGKHALARDLNLYFPGLASVLSFASLSVRPLFLSVFESHILQLDGSALRPALKAIILSLLPGLEDETSEDFERMVSALDKLRKAVQSHSDEVTDVGNASESSHFWQCFFLATITNASRRQGALAFLVRRLPKFGLPGRRTLNPNDSTIPIETLPVEAEAAVSPEPGLLVRCFESGLLDSQLLIQRGFLDLLVSHLPLDSPILQQRINKGDLERLVAAASSVVSRRDMSLNRRLWAWFLGPEPAAIENDGNVGSALNSPTQDKHNAVADPSAYQAAYFSHYGLEALSSSVLKMINRRGKSPSERARPFRVCLSLMDRWEVGGLIVPEIFLPALQSVQSYSEVASKEEVEEVMKSASAFFDGVDSGLIWGKLVHLVTSSLNVKAVSRDEALQQSRLAKFVLARFNLKEEDMVLHHMPLMVLSTLVSLNEAFADTTNSSVDPEVVDIAFEITDSLVQIVPDRAFQPDQGTKLEMSEAGKALRETALQQIKIFYDESQGSLDATDAPFNSAELGQMVLREASSMFAASMEHKIARVSAEMPSRILANLISKVQDMEAVSEVDPSTVLQRVLSTFAETRENLPFTHLSAMTGVLFALQTSRLSEPFIAPSQLSEIFHPLVASLWHYLSPLMPKYHVEAAQCILQLHTVAPASRMVEAAISSIIVEQLSQTSSNANTADCGQRFALLWTHTMYEMSLQSEKRGALIRRPSGNNVTHPSLPPGEFHAVLTRPLLLLLDTLTEEASETSTFIRSWLQDLPSLNMVFEVLAIHMQSLQCLNATESLIPDEASKAPRPRSRGDDSKECLYYLGHFLQILKHPSQMMWATLAEAPAEGSSSRTSLQEWLVRTCLRTLSVHVGSAEIPTQLHISQLHQTSVSLISQIYQSPFSFPLRELELEVPLMARLKTAGPSLQGLLLGAILSALKLRLTRPTEEPVPEPKTPGQPTHLARMSMALSRASLDTGPTSIPPPPQLVECLKYGFSSPASRLVLDDWVQFLIEVLPMFADTIFQNLLPLVECFCKQIGSTFEHLKSTFEEHIATPGKSPESTLISLINGLEQILAKAHDRLMLQETKTSATRSPEQPQGFFSNVVSGVFASDINQTRTPTANSRLTVLLCFQDTVRICFAIWSWGGYGQKQAHQDPTSALSLGYTSLRMRNRARRILEHLFAAEALECLETLAVLWTHAAKDDIQETAIMGLLNVLNGSKPKHTIPAIFNAVYSRTDPNALDTNRMSTLTSNLSDTDLVAFLVEYTKSLEDDAMDEIWQDCTLFLRDVLANPLPHRQILPTLLEFTAVIGQKVDNTHFGEQRKMRRELADIFARILTAVFTTRSMGYLQDPNQVLVGEKVPATTNGSYAQKRATDVVSILISIVPNLPIILVENDRVTKVISDISTSVIGPTFRARSFPDNVTESMLNLLRSLTKIAQGNKFLKKDIQDSFNDPKFFNTPLPLLRDSWLPILAQWTQSDKDRVPELLSRLSAPTTAGIMFGVGAASARQEADRRTQLTFRRITLLVLASPEDAFTPNIPQIMEKAVELLTATPASSPSSATRADVLILLRAVILRTSPVHLAPLWPVINGELTSALSSLLPDADNKEHYTNASIVQACKLLDQLVVLDPDDFQLMEWLFITDTIDAVYKPTVAPPLLSLTDEINEVLAYTSGPNAALILPPQSYSNTDDPKRTLLLDPLINALEKEEGAAVLDMARRELVDRVVRPFLGAMAMNAFEARYGGGDADWEGVWRSVVRDAGS